MVSHETKVALWHRLRNDPDFQPEWLRGMGARPPTLEPHRVWGDAKRHGHTIDSMSWSQGWVICAADGEYIGTDDGQAALIALWALHTGQRETATEVFTSGSLADDSDVSEFLHGVSDPGTHYEADSGLTAGSASLPNEEAEHRECQHGPGGYCLVAYALLPKIIASDYLTGVLA